MSTARTPTEAAYGELSSVPREQLVDRVAHGAGEARIDFRSQREMVLQRLLDILLGFPRLGTRVYAL